MKNMKWIGFCILAGAVVLIRAEARMGNGRMADLSFTDEKTLVDKNLKALTAFEVSTGSRGGGSDFVSSEYEGVELLEDEFDAIRNILRDYSINSLPEGLRGEFQNLVSRGLIDKNRELKIRYSPQGCESGEGVRDVVISAQGISACIRSTVTTGISGWRTNSMNLLFSIFLGRKVDFALVKFFEDQHLSQRIY